MKIKKILVFLTIFFLVTGCSSFYIVCSLYPFYLEENITNEDEIEGTWKANVISLKDIPDDWYWGATDTLCQWKIKRSALTTKYITKGGLDSIRYHPEKHYLVELIGNSPDTALYKFKLVLFRVNNALYGDFSPSGNTVLKNSMMIKSNYFRVHTLARITIKSDEIKVSFLSDDTMKQLIGEKRARIKHRLIGETDRLVLTALPKDLTSMIEQYGHLKRFIDWEGEPTALRLTPFKTVKP